MFTPLKNCDYIKASFKSKYVWISEEDKYKYYSCFEKLETFEDIQILLICSALFTIWA